MKVTRIYQAVNLEIGNKLSLDEKNSHHLARVLRANVGDELTVFNGQGGEYFATIHAINKKSVEVTIKSFSPREAKSPINIHIAQGIARGEKMDFIVQKATELGVHEITPIITERCNVRLSGEREEKRWQHWQLVAISTCEQSGRNDIPHINPPIDYYGWLKNVQFDLGYVLSPHVQQKTISNELPDQATIALIIGPEGGLSDKEVEAAQQANFQSLCLGSRILRTETAALAAISVLQSRFGDFSDRRT